MAGNDGKNFRIIGADGRPLSPPSKENPKLPQLEPIPVARIDQLPNGTFGIRRMRAISPYDMAKILCNLAASILEIEIRNGDDNEGIKDAKSVAKVAAAVIQGIQNRIAVEQGVPEGPPGEGA